MKTEPTQGDSFYNELSEQARLHIKTTLAKAGALPLDKQQLDALSDQVFLEDDAEWQASYRRICEQRDDLMKAVKSAIACLSQNKTFPADIALALKNLRSVVD